MTSEEKFIQRDRMRFTKNTASSSLALLAILLNVFYFVSIYKSDVGTYYYTILIGASIIYNLVFMLATFLCSEGVKNYKASFGYAMIVIGVLQIIRIFILPMHASKATIVIKEVETIVMGPGQFTRLLVYLIASAACLIAGGIIAIYKSRELAQHEAALEQKAA
jgi:hypothetical protein